MAPPGKRFGGFRQSAITQEFLAEMLGVKRTSVTLHARTLQQAGMINYSRGQIQITDVEALQETVCECYGTVKSYYDALLGPHTGVILHSLRYLSV